MLAREVAISIADVNLLRRNVSRLGGYARGLLDLLDLGLDKEKFSRHLEETNRHLETVARPASPLTVSLRPQEYTDRGLVEESGLPWNYPQTFRFASGACMISQMYYRWMSEENVRRSTAAKVLYKCQTGILDDLIDKGDYTYLEANSLYHLVLSSMTDPALDSNAFMKRLMASLRQEQLSLFDLIASITSNFNTLFNISTYGRDLFYQMAALDEKVALGQALTMFQKEPHMDLGQVASIAKGFDAMDSGTTWYERLANYVSGGTRYNLIDISFLDRRLKESRLRGLLRGWFYFDVVIVFLNNVVSIHEDLKSGIANLSLVAMREKEVLPLTALGGYEPGLTVEDYERHLARLGNLASKGLDILSRSFPDPHQYFPFITMMMPVVMLADWIGKSDDMVAVYLENLAPALRRAADRSESLEKQRLPAKAKGRSKTPAPI